VGKFWEDGVEKNIRRPPGNAWRISQLIMHFVGKEQVKHLLLKMYSAIAALQLLPVLTPRKPNSKAQHMTENVLTTQGFQFP